MSKPLPNFEIETSTNAKYVAGIDEAGCGPWAGPVVACALIFKDYSINNFKVNDSKKLSQKNREELYLQLTQSPNVLFGVGIVSSIEIDELNIAVATKLAMRRAVDKLSIRPDYLIIDGIRDPNIDIPTKLIVKGDQKSGSIAAASIIAKVERDKIMHNLHQEHPNYLWANNAGYGTKAHSDAILKHGVTIHHRRSFKPIKDYLENI